MAVRGSTHDWTSVTSHQAHPHPPMMVFLLWAPQHPPVGRIWNTHRLVHAGSTRAVTHFWTSVTSHQAQDQPPMTILRERAPQHPPMMVQTGSIGQSNAKYPPQSAEFYITDVKTSHRTNKQKKERKMASEYLVKFFLYEHIYYMCNSLPSESATSYGNME